MEAIRNFLYRLFHGKIDYKYLYSSAWNKEKSDYLRKKVRGKKSIRWYEKKSPGSYSDKRLNRFVNSISIAEDKHIDDTPEVYNTKEGR